MNIPRIWGIIFWLGLWVRFYHARQGQRIATAKRARMAEKVNIARQLSISIRDDYFLWPDVAPAVGMKRRAFDVGIG